MPTKIIYIGTKPASSTGADVESNGPLSPANVDQIHANLQAAVDSKAPAASPTFSGTVTSSLNAGVAFDNTSGTTAQIALRLQNGGGRLYCGVEGAVAAIISGAGAYDTSFVGQAGISFSANNGASPHVRIDSSGNLRVGAVGGTWHVIYKSVTADAGNIVFSTGNGTGETAYFYAVNGGAVGSAANAAVKINKDSITSRSINAGGTINASGADYAEYIRKAELCAPVLKGQIIGFNLDGGITDKWVDAISFGVKSTNPNLVGGDTWGSAEAVGERPVEPAKDAPHDEKDQYALSLADFEARLETERQKFDRIAFSGMVPCNVAGATPGDYIIAVQDGEGIAGIAVASPTFEQYLKAVGRVKQILEDGRPEIAVIVH